MMKNVYTSACSVLLPILLSAQAVLTFDPTVPVIRNGSPLAMAWAGGLNYPQFSDIDLDGDGDMDLFLFDRSGNKVITLLNNNVPGQASYTFTHAYDHVYPFDDLQQWALLRDYNCDGKEDIFSYMLGGFGVWKNTSTGGNLSFEEVDTLVRSNYVPTDANLYVTQVDIPGIEDVDGDGDLDVVTFSIFGNYEEYHRNMSMEIYGTCDSLVFELRNRCWGYFSENLNNNSVTLNNPCQFNIPNPETPVQIEKTTAQLRSQYHLPISEEEEEGARAHVGSSTLLLDLDGDGDKDLILGDVLFSNLLALTNGGDIDSTYMVAQDSLFPVYDQPLHLDIFPAAFYEDVDNDAKRDLIVTPDYPSLSENFQSVWYYHNNGTDAAPIFHKIQEDLFQDRMIDLGEGAYPVTFDIDGDGLMDLLVSNYGYYELGGTYPGKIAAFRNSGTATAPAFTLLTDDYMGLSTMGMGSSMYPAFGDMDGDGDMDLYIGDLQGRLHYFQNNPVGLVAQFTLNDPTVTTIVNDTDTILMDVGQFATPQLVDMDNDGLLDLLIGERNGNINYYHNRGAAGEPFWELKNDSIGGVVVAEYWNVTGHSVPFMHVTNGGQHELLVGSESGWIHQYDNIDGNIDGTWNLVDSTWQDLHEGERTALCLYDFNNDGYKDAVIGNYRGGISYWRNDFAAAVHGISALTSDAAFTLSPNPSEESTFLDLNMPVSRDLRVDVLDELGRAVLSSRMEDQCFRIDTRPLKQGVYMVRLSNGANRWAQRLSVVR